MPPLTGVNKHTCGKPTMKFVRKANVMRAARPLFASVLFSLSLISCGGGGGPVPLAFQSMQEQFSGTYAAGTYVFRTQADMEAAWAAAPQQFGTPMEMPVIDFSRNTVVGVSLGTGIRCDTPRIVAVYELGGAVQVSYFTNQGTGVTTLACLHQWRLSDFATIPATGEPVQFERTTQQ
jgi:hypothetical protein